MCVNKSYKANATCPLQWSPNEICPCMYTRGGDRSQEREARRKRRGAFIILLTMISAEVDEIALLAFAVIGSALVITLFAFGYIINCSFHLFFPFSSCLLSLYSFPIFSCIFLLISCHSDGFGKTREVISLGSKTSQVSNE